MEIPIAFKRKIMNSFGIEGEIWLASLEEKINTYLNKWGLTNLGPVLNLSYNYVIKTEDKEGNRHILKAGVRETPAGPAARQADRPKVRDERTCFLPYFKCEM